MQLDLGRRRERCLLALLLLETGEVVPAERLIDLLWDGTPPLSARTTLQAHVSRLRTVLDPHRDAQYGLCIRKRGRGYLVEADRTAIDVHQFTDLVTSARAEPDAHRQAAQLRAALALWRGPAMAGAASDTLRRRVTVALDELRLEATEAAIDAELRCGRHRELIPELTALTAEHPLREQHWAQLAVALYRSDRQADALDALERARDQLAGTLGIDPGIRLRELHRQILSADPALTTAGDHPAVVVHQLPADIADFTGREKELHELDVLAAEASTPGNPVAICTIEGMPGVGKTRLAIRAAHNLRRRGQFRNVQLWANLRGFHPDLPPADPALVLEEFLRRLGVPSHQVPPDLDARAALYRDRLSRSRALVVLDNAANDAQVRPLLPGESGSVVLITSRRALSGLDGARPLHLAGFSTSEALALLAHHTGTQRVRAELDAARLIVERCGNLPLVVALVARHLRRRPARKLTDLALRLDSGDRLDEALPHADTVRATFDLSYNSLIPQHRRLLRLLAHHPGETFAAASVAALAGVTTGQAEAVLDTLLDERLLQQHGTDRYGMHDLIRQYVSDLSQGQDSDNDRRAAFERVTRHYLALAEQATLAVHPTESRRISTTTVHNGWRTPVEAAAWAESECTNLVAAVHRATADCPALAVRLTFALYRPLANRGHSYDRITLNEIAARTAHRLGDLRSEAQACEDVGTLCAQVGELTTADEYNERALRLWTGLDDRPGRQACLAALGNTRRLQGRTSDAIDLLERAVRLGEESGGGATALDYLGLAHLRTGRYDLAVDCLTRSARVYATIGNRLGEAIAVANRGWAHQRAGRPHQAIPDHRDSLATFRDLGDRYNEAEQHWGLGQAHHTIGDVPQARHHWTRAITILGDIHLLDDQAAQSLLAQDIPETPEIIRLNT